MTGLPDSPLSSLSREAEQRRQPGAERRRAERGEVVVEVVADGHDDGGGDARPCKAPGEALGGQRAVLVVVAGDDQARDAGRGANAPRLPAESAAAAPISGTAVMRDSTVSIPSPTTSEASPSAGTAQNRTVSNRTAPNRTACPKIRPSALRVVGMPALAGRRGSSQVRWTPSTAPSLPVTAATRAGNRRTDEPSR